MSNSLLRPFLVPLLLSFAACNAPEGPPRRNSPPPLEEEKRQRDALEAAKAASREAAIEDLYRQWRTDYLEFAREVEDVRAAREANASSSPVRSLDDLLAETDPEFEDPAAREAFADWRAKSAGIRNQLQALENDPETDVRSPLLPQVRDALRAEAGLVEDEPGSDE